MFPMKRFFPARGCCVYIESRCDLQLQPSYSHLACDVCYMLTHINTYAVCNLVSIRVLTIKTFLKVEKNK